jgi:hypothetical protein
MSEVVAIDTRPFLWSNTLNAVQSEHYKLAITKTIEAVTMMDGVFGFDRITPGSYAKGAAYITPASHFLDPKAKSAHYVHDAQVLRFTRVWLEGLAEKEEDLFPLLPKHKTYSTTEIRWVRLEDLRRFAIELTHPVFFVTCTSSVIQDLTERRSSFWSIMATKIITDAGADGDWTAGKLERAFEDWQACIAKHLPLFVLADSNEMNELIEEIFNTTCKELGATDEQLEV